jgi:glycosyltransferase involved in cell wall biosynthesis
MRVCFISHSANRQGADRSLLETVQVVQRNGVGCHVLVPTKGPLIDDIRKLDISYTIWPYYWWVFKDSDPLWKRGLKYLYTILWLSLLPLLCLKIRRLKFDLIYTNTAVTPLGGLIAFLLRKPHIWHLREFVEEDHKLRFFFGPQITGFLLNFLGTFFIANSRAVADKFQKIIPNDKLKVIYQGVGINRGTLSEIKRDVSPDRFRCILIGRLQKSKGQEVAIKAVGNLVQQGFDIELWVVGDGEKDYRTKLESLVDAEGLKKNVRFFGYVKHPLPLVQNCDVLLMCSANEAFGRVTVEGMKAGLPVIGARAGGTSELILDGFNGFFFEPENHMELGEKIRYFIENKELVQTMGQAGQKWANDNFTEERYAKEIMESFEFVIRNRKL